MKAMIDPARIEQGEAFSAPQTRGQPQPLLRKIPPGRLYPIDALGPLKAAVLAVQKHRQAPVAIPAQSALAVASLAVQGHADVETLGGGFAPLSLYCLTIAASGERMLGEGFVQGSPV